MCGVCRSSKIHTSTRAERYRKQNLAGKAKVIFEVLCAQQLTIGDFLMILCDQNELLKKEMSSSMKVEIACFLHGQKKSNQPLDFGQHLDAGVRESQRECMDSSYEALQKFFVEKVVEQVQWETELLQKDPSLRSLDNEKQGFSWETIAIGDERATLLRGHTMNGKRDGKGSNHIRDPYLGCTVGLSMMLSFRNQRINRIQSILGMLMFAMNTNQTTVSILRWIGLVVAHSTTHNWLHMAVAGASANIKAIGHQVVENKVSVHLVYDNLNQYHQEWRPSLDNHTSLESGTAATLIIQ
ncbi:uncharacterized protein EI90DRAFT_3026412 [Cantharellus anzutake]|uniref:uncharacterized protein n=1 Tax=Cantharellus anzutake TaxID=1750568 RepID=UPI00190752C7|nr:uncharacterized protein EI90DRAFT_3026412 [Cantharellus anzutake]KAF8307580.1 hypothetical protein EI90DRAFT_3026412 [Cantharellus anzutake]